MISPFEGRLTSNHADSGGYAGHKGTDIAPAKPGQTGLPIYAAFAGVVKKAVSWSTKGNRYSTWAPGRTGNGVLIANPDGEGQGYNHMRPVVEVGQTVKEGQLLGYNDSSGNQSGPHLHFETWASWTNPNSDYDSQLLFKKYKVSPGSKPVLPTTPKPVVKPQPVAVKVLSAPVKAALKGMGLPESSAGVKQFQIFHGLVADGVWGSKTSAKWVANRRLQNALKRTKGVPDTWASDGFVGPTTLRWKAYVLDRQGWTNANLITNLKRLGIY